MGDPVMMFWGLQQDLMDPYAQTVRRLEIAS